MAGKGPQPRPGFDQKKYRESSFWDTFGPNKKDPTPEKKDNGKKQTRNREDKDSSS